MLQQERLRDRIGQFQNPTGHVQIYNPAQESPDYLPANERFNKDFASYEKEQRALRNQKK